MSSGQKRVVVVGGSYSGCAAALTLEAKLPKDVQIVLIEPKTMFYHCIASVRAVVDTKFAQNLFIPYDKMFKNPAQHKILHAFVVEMSENQVVLDKKPSNLTDNNIVSEENGKYVIRFDYAVIATGCAYPTPYKMNDANIDAQRKALELAADSIKKANNIFIVGGGPIGIETAGEIKTYYPNKSVTVVSSSENILPGPYGDKLRVKVMDALNKKGIKVILNSRVQQVPATYEDQFNPQTVTLSDGSSHEADIVMKCVGSTKYSTRIQYNVNANVLNDQGFVKVSREMQVEGCKTLFAVGDGSTASDEKHGYLSELQAQVAAKNIANLMIAKEKGKDNVKLDVYTPLGSNSVIFVTLGNDSGACQLPFAHMAMGSTLVKMAKGKDLFVSKYWNTLKQTPPKN